MKWQYDLEVPVSYPFYECPTRGAQFYGGGPALHEKDCQDRASSYSNCIAHFGPKQVEEVKDMATRWGDDWDWYGISLNMLRRDFPELVKDLTE